MFYLHNISLYFIVMFVKKYFLLCFTSIILFSACTTARKVPTYIPFSLQQQSSPTPTIISTQGESMEKIEAKEVVVTTTKGDIVIELYSNDAPHTVQNFLQKAKTGYYANLTFHRVESWVVQGGDPRGNGTGGGKMPTELSDRKFEVGSVGVARGGDINVSNDSQFFICTDDCSWLTGQYTNFGKVTKGMDIVKKIVIGDKILKITYK